MASHNAVFGSFLSWEARAIRVAKLTLAFAIRIAPVCFLNSVPFRLGSLCSYCFTKLSRITLPGTVLTARISLPLRMITRFRCAFGVVMTQAGIRLLPEALPRAQSVQKAGEARAVRATVCLDRVREAKKSLSDATAWIEQIWNQLDSIDWRFAVSDRFSNVYADIAWCQAILKESTDEIAFAVARAKGRESLAHSRELRRSTLNASSINSIVDPVLRRAGWDWDCHW